MICFISTLDRLHLLLLYKYLDKRYIKGRTKPVASLLEVEVANQV